MPRCVCALCICSHCNKKWKKHPHDGCIWMSFEDWAESILYLEGVVNEH